MLSVPYPAVLPVWAGQEGDHRAMGPDHPSLDLCLVPGGGERGGSSSDPGLVEAVFICMEDIWDSEPGSLPSPISNHIPYPLHWMDSAPAALLPVRPVGAISMAGKRWRLCAALVGRSNGWCPLNSL